MAVGLCAFIATAIYLPAQKNENRIDSQQKLVQVMHSIHSRTLFDYVEELASDKYGGRLSGTQGYDQSTEWVISHFVKWGLLPAGDNHTYLQAFLNPYTLVFEDCFLYMNIPVNSETIRKYYQYEKEFIPGSTSGSGEVTAEVVYVGYGITAPELDFDEYQGMDVEGKIVLMEREAPVSPNDDPEVFKKWRPYSFHQYKLKNAVAHGARGMLYNYHITNPNNAYDENFIYSHVGKEVVDDVFAGTGKEHGKIKARITKELKPQSFSTNKVFTIKNTTEHHPDGITYNVVGMIPGSDPKLKYEAVIIGAHLDHLGRCYEIMPGANDNASGVAVVLGLAEALIKSPVKPKRSVLFICFGAEEQGVMGSKYYVENPYFPLEKTICFINLDAVGAGNQLNALSAQNFPELWGFIKRANEKYTHRLVFPRYFLNIGRPRLDAARFLWAGVPSISFSAFGTPSYYHVTKDDIHTIIPEIMEDLAQMLFMAVLALANQDQIDFRESDN